MARSIRSNSGVNGSFIGIGIVGILVTLIALNCWTIVPANHEASATSFGDNTSMFIK